MLHQNREYHNGPTREKSSGNGQHGEKRSRIGTAWRKRLFGWRWPLVLLVFVFIAWSVGTLCFHPSLLLAQESGETQVEDSNEVIAEEDPEEEAEEAEGESESAELQKEIDKLLEQIMEEEDPEKVEKLMERLEELSERQQANLETNPAENPPSLPAGEEVKPAAPVPAVPVPQPAAKSVVKPAAEKPVVPTTPTNSGKTPALSVEPVDPNAKAVPAGIQYDPEATVKIKIEENMLDVNELINVVGMNLKFSFLYDTPAGVTGQVKMQQFGEIKNRDLLPLLESVLSFFDYTMIREDPFIRIVKRTEAHKKALPTVGKGPELAPVAAGDSVISQILEMQHIKPAEAIAFLQQFVSDPSVLVPVANTNYLIVTEYARRLPRILEMLELIDQPGPSRRLEPLTVQYIKADEAVKQMAALIKDLQGQQSTAASAPAPTPTPRRTPTRTQRPGETPAATGVGTTTTVEGGPAFHVDGRTNRIFVIATDEQILQVKELLALLDIKDGPAIRLETIQVTNVIVKDITSQLTEMIEALNEKDVPSTTGTSTTPAAQGTPAEARAAAERMRSRTISSRNRNQSQYSTATRAGDEGPVLIEDEKTNRLFVIGSDEQIRQVKELLTLLDVLPYYEQLIIKIYQPQYVEAAEMQKILSDLGIIKSDRDRPRDRARQAREGEPEEINRPITTAANAEAAEAGIPGETAAYPALEEAEIRVAILESVNKMFVLATERQHRNIEDMMRQVDMEPNEYIGAIQIYPLENRKPEDVATMLKDLLESEKLDVKKEQFIPGKEGAPIIVALEDIYAIAVRGSAKQHRDIEQIIKKLDKRLPQVLVEAILVQVNSNDALKVGVSLKNKYDVGGERTVSGISPFSLADDIAIGTNGIVSGTGGTIGFYEGDFIYATLEAWQQDGNAKIVSKPRIMVNDNEKGSITSERQEPTSETVISPGSDTPITSFKGYESAGTTLDITPHISEGDFLSLEISLQVNSFDGEGSGNLPPAKTSNQITTLVTVPHDKIIVLGGLGTRTDSLAIEKVPLLGDIPLIGALFRKTTQSQLEGVLYVFVKANIVRDDNFEDLEELSEKNRLQLRGREDDYRKNSEFIPGLPASEEETPKSALED